MEQRSRVVPRGKFSKRLQFLGAALPRNFDIFLFSLHRKFGAILFSQKKQSDISTEFSCEQAPKKIIKICLATSTYPNKSVDEKKLARDGNKLNTTKFTGASIGI